MPALDPSRAVLEMRPTVESIRETAAALLASEGAESAGALDAFRERVIQVSLDWMARARTDELNQLMHALSDALPVRLPDGLSAVDRLASSLTSWLQGVAVYMRTSNLIRSMGALTGSRRAGWRDLLLSVHARRRPVRRAEAGDLAGRSMRPDAAEKALDAMAELGLLVRREEGPKNVVFELSWSGLSVATELAGEPERELRPAPRVNAPKPVKVAVAAVTARRVDRSNSTAVARPAARAAAGSRGRREVGPRSSSAARPSRRSARASRT